MQPGYGRHSGQQRTVSAPREPAISRYYLHRADYCRRIASRVADPTTRRDWIMLADGWSSMARQALRFAEPLAVERRSHLR